MVCCMGAEPADGLLWLMCGGNKPLKRRVYCQLCGGMCVRKGSRERIHQLAADIHLLHYRHDCVQCQISLLKGYKTYKVNSLTTDDTFWRSQILAACYQLEQSVLKIGSAL